MPYAPRGRAKTNFTCRIHPGSKAVSKGICPNCYTRLRSLKELGLVTDKTSDYLIDRLLKLDVPHGGRGGSKLDQYAREEIKLYKKQVGEE